MILKLERY